MKAHNTGRLQAYLDDALTPEEHRAVETHLDECAECRGELDELRSHNAVANARLSLLDPAEDEIPDVEEALQQFRSVAGERMPLLERLMRSIEMTRKTLLSKRWRPAMAGLMSLMVLAVLFSFAPVRGVAAQILDVFRVRKFAVIPVTMEKFEEIQSLEGVVETMLGEPTFLREPGPVQEAADVAEASAMAGYAVRTPAYLPEGAEATFVHVEQGPAMHFEAERETILALAAVAGVDDLPLPDDEILMADLDFPIVVSQEYRGEEFFVRVIQAPSPTAALPAGLETTVLGEILLKWLGVPETDARRLSQTIDWTSTLVIPLPGEISSFREVDVDGVTGMMISESYDEASTAGPIAMVSWQRDGMVYAVIGQRTNSSTLLRVANSLSR